VKLQEILKKLFHVKKSKYKFPCKECIILLTGNCRELCNKVEMDNNIIKVLFETYECCPDCGCKQFFEGPCGGLSQNVTCSNCRHNFNWTLPLFIERI